MPPPGSRHAHPFGRVAKLLSTSYAGVPLRDVQEATSHAERRTTMRYESPGATLDRNPATYIAGAAL
jgi:hypothetical protein